jgi:chloramphenicol 3-O phosphotransferase
MSVISRAIVVLNGPSSSGKSTLARAVQNHVGVSCALVSIDQLYPCLHPERDNDWELFRTLTRTLFACARSFHEQGLHVVVDAVFERPECLEICRSICAPNLALVGLSCPLEVLERRELVRQDRRIGLARTQNDRVHAGCEYDLVLDTGLYSPEECAAQVVALMAQS